MKMDGPLRCESNYAHLPGALFSFCLQVRHWELVRRPTSPPEHQQVARPTITAPFRTTPTMPPIVDTAEPQNDEDFAPPPRQTTILIAHQLPQPLTLTRALPNRRIACAWPH